MPINFCFFVLHKSYHLLASSSTTEPTDITSIGCLFVKKDLKALAPFPKDDSNRCFQPGWADRYEWIEYSKEKNAVFCYPCRQFSRPHKTDAVFVNRGFCAWKSALASDRGFAKHGNSEIHLSSMVAWNEQKKRANSNLMVSNLVDSSVLEMRRYYVKSIIGVIQFVVENELSLRGNWDAVSSTENGTFMNLFKYTLEKDEKLKACHAIIPDYAKYTSPEIQNELIEILAHCVRQAIVADVNKANYLTLYLDGTKDKQRREILSISMRYICNGEPVESVLGFERSKFLDAKSIAQVVIDALKSYGVEKLIRIICQCYDGAFVMQGGEGGVRFYINKEVGRDVPYVHCFNHRLHLVIVYVVKDIQLVNNFFGDVSVVYKFFQRYKVKESYGGTALKKLIETRWTGHLFSTKAISCNFKEIRKCLSDIVKNEAGTFDSDDIVTAVGISSSISNMNFVFFLHFFKAVLEIISPADKLLQTRTVGYKIGKPIIDQTIKQLKEMKMDEVFTSYYSQAETDLLESEPSNDPTTQAARITRRRSTMRSESVQSEQRSKLNEIFTKTLDTVISEMESRFEERSDILIALDSVCEFDRSNIMPLKKVGIKIPEKNELDFVKKFVETEKNKSEEGFNYLKTLHQMKDVFQDTYNLMEATETFGCSTSICESSFSALNRIGTVGRMSMTSDRLCNLALLAFECKRLKRIDKMDVLKEFNSRKNRRLQLF